MGAVVTSRRPLLAGSSRYYEKTSGQPATVTFQDAGKLLGAEQVTTSYRTGRAAAGSVAFDDEEDTRLLSATNYRERFKSLKDERLAEEKTSPYDIGNEFQTTLNQLDLFNWISESTRVPGWAGAYTDYSFDGHVTSVPSFHTNGSTWLSAAPPDVGWYGPRAIKNTIPTAPTADLAIALAELKREGFSPSRATSYDQFVKELRSGHAEKAGSQKYLELEFGWKPLLQDIVDTMTAIVDAKSIIKQYQRDSGKNIRREYTFPYTKSVEYLPDKVGRVYPHAASTGPNFLFVSGNLQGTLSESITTERWVWFSGAYTYYLQQGGNIFEKMDVLEQKANRLLGLRLTPEVLWNLAPWSWLSDWNLNLGDNIANASALSSDGLVLRYGYLMVTTRVTHTCSILGPVTLSGKRGPWTTSWITTKKERFRARPYGFGSDPASYTNRQWSILGALGISKVPGHLM